MRIYRIHPASRNAADFGGSLIVAGRWNPAGTAMLYCSTALSLACLEILVHMNADEIPPGCAFSTGELAATPDIADFRGRLLDDDATRRYGHTWALSQRSMAILVPSVVIPIEFNVLLNPTHSGFGEVQWSAPKVFGFDRRLFLKFPEHPADE
jgi:RES domain-containing protein